MKKRKSLLSLLVFCLTLLLILVVTNKKEILEKLGTNSPEEEIFFLGGQKELFFDENIISFTSEVIKKYHQAQKYEQNPIIRNDTPPDEQLAYLYGNVIFDEKEKLFKMWYLGFPKGYDFQQSFVLYAISKDGKKWEKPNLGLVEFNGNKENNIVFFKKGIIYAPSIVIDPKAPEEKCYKMLFFNAPPDDKSKWGIGIAFSKNGLNWKEHELNPILPGESNDALSAFYDKRLEKTVLFDKKLFYFDPERGPVRIVERRESQDGIQWSEPKDVLVPTEEEIKNGIHFYYLTVFQEEENNYIGILHKFDAKPESGRILPYLVFSQDGINWNFVSEEPFIPLGRLGEFDSEEIVMVPPVIKENQMLFYYGGFNRNHHTFDDTRKAQIGLATLVLDRFISFENKDSKKQGKMITKPIIFQGENLYLNAEIREGGWLKIEILNEKGKKIKNLEKRIDGYQNLIWEKVLNVEKIKDKPIKIKFTLFNTILYGFQFKD